MTVYKSKQEMLNEVLHTFPQVYICTLAFQFTFHKLNLTIPRIYIWFVIIIIVGCLFCCFTSFYPTQVYHISIGEGIINPILQFIVGKQNDSDTVMGIMSASIET